MISPPSPRLPQHTWRCFCIKCCCDSEPQTPPPPTSFSSRTQHQAGGVIGPLNSSTRIGTGSRPTSGADEAAPTISRQCTKGAPFFREAALKGACATSQSLWACCSLLGRAGTLGAKTSAQLRDGGRTRPPPFWSLKVSSKFRTAARCTIGLTGPHLATSAARVLPSHPSTLVATSTNLTR